MGILVQHPASSLSEKAFHRLDYKVMALAFDLYNSIGNLWDEVDYKSKLLDQCISNGLDAKAEVSVQVSYKNFQKPYFIDLLIEGAVYELKTACDIAAQHESQTLNYLFLTNTQHGKIINFRCDSLQWRFLSTSLLFGDRTSYTLEKNQWHASCQATEILPELLSELLNEWGAYLDLRLYKEALLFFLGLSTEHAHQRFNPLSTESLIHVTGLSRKQSVYKKNLQKYLDASIYQHVEWINFDQNQIKLHTLNRNHSATKLFCP